MTPNTIVLAKHLGQDLVTFRADMEDKWRQRFDPFPPCKWVAACLPGEAYIDNSLLAQAIRRSDREAVYILKWNPGLFNVLPAKHDFAIWMADGRNEVVYDQVSDCCHYTVCK